MKKFILCADGFGMTQDYNRAVLNGYSSGFVRSASLVANGEAYEAAVNEISPECQQLSIGVQLNLSGGKSITRCRYLTDVNGNFHLSPSKISVLAKKSDVLDEIETEFRAQIEKIKSSVKVYHINTVKNIHSYPAIFSLVCKLAEEYQIPYVRSLYEELYFLPDVKYILNFKYFTNLYSLIRFNCNHAKNKKFFKNYNLNTNDYIIGLGYNGIMNAKALELGLKTLADEDDIVVESVIYPCSYLRNINNNHSVQYKMTQDKILEDTICRMGYEITNHKNI